MPGELFPGEPGSLLLAEVVGFQVSSCYKPGHLAAVFPQREQHLHLLLFQNDSGERQVYSSTNVEES